MDMLFDELIQVCTRFSTTDWDLNRKDMSWIVGQLRMEIDNVGMDFEADLGDTDDDTDQGTGPDVEPDSGPQGPELT